MAAVLVDDAGWYGAARRYDSPNVNARPDGCAVELLVVHNITLPPGQFGALHIADLFTNRLDFARNPPDLRGLEVSSHFLIRRGGGVIQFASCAARAWHAGLSAFEGRAGCNDFSVGVELEGTDALPFTPEQYAALAALTAALQARYPLRAVAGHQHVAPGRKTDPGPCFDWPRYGAALPAAREKLLAAAPGLVFAHRLLGFPSGLENVKAAREKK